MVHMCLFMRVLCPKHITYLEGTFDSHMSLGYFILSLAWPFIELNNVFISQCEMNFRLLVLRKKTFLPLKWELSQFKKNLSSMTFHIDLFPQ